MLICGFHGRSMSPELAGLIERHHVSAFVLYDIRNIAGASQVRRLAGSIRRSCLKALGVPPLLAIDNEGGVNSQLRSAGTVFPGSLALAAGGDPRQAGLEGGAIAGEIRAAGLNMNLAPVLDLYDRRNPGIGVRSFGSDPATVARFALPYLKGHLDAGVLAAAKHFPGNSVTDTDPHWGLAEVKRTKRELWRLDLAPYRALIRAGLPAVLTSHALYPALDLKSPATLSPAILTGLLRKRMGFGGVVISDDVEMAAIEKRFGLEGAVEKAVLAGVDLVMVCHTYEKMRRAVEHLKRQAVRDPVLEARIRESTARVDRLRRQAQANAGGHSTPGRRRRAVLGGVLRSAANKALARTQARAAVTVIRDRDHLLPLRLGAGGRLGVINPLHTMYGWNQEVRLDAAFRRLGCAASGALFDPRAPSLSLERCLALARGSGAVVAGTYDAVFSPPQADLVRRLARLRKPLILIATRSPRDAAVLAEIGTCVACYSFYDVSISAAAEAVLGLVPATGRLPVKLEDIEGGGR
jgi:beta-N-acetylhexosaminidase